jgi:hypothetical protein
MTVIAYDGTTIAADSLRTYGNERCLWPARKLHFRHRLIYALCGAASLTDAVIGWYQHGAKYKEMPVSADPKEYDWSLWVIDPREPDKFTSIQSVCGYPSIAHPPFAMGTGADYATGALAAGKGAIQAVQVAIKLEIHCGPPVQSIDIADCLLHFADSSFEVGVNLSDWAEAAE